VYELVIAQVWFGFAANQVVLFAAIWIAGATSALARSHAFGLGRKRRTLGDKLAYAATAGFACVCILGIVSMGVGADLFERHSVGWVCIAAGIGALGEEQHALMRSMLLGLLETLSKKKDDNDK
jgi:hypothetical protein